MRTLPGYTASSLTSGARPGEYVFKQAWETKQAYEDYHEPPGATPQPHGAGGVPADA